MLSDAARHSLFRRKLLDRIEGIVRESVRPMEKIEGIRILQVDGLNGGNGGNGGRSATDEVIDSALRHRVQAPLIDSILADIGVEGGSLAKMPGLMREARDMQGIRKEAAPKKDAEPALPTSGGGGRAWRDFRRARRSTKEELRSIHGARLRLQRRQRPKRPGLGSGVRLQRHAELAPGDRGKSDRRGRAGGQDRLRARFPPAQRRQDPRKAARPLRLRHVLRLLDPRIADGGGELCGDPAVDPGDRWRPHLRGVDGRVRLPARARGGPGR